MILGKLIYLAESISLPMAFGNDKEDRELKEFVEYDACVSCCP